MFADSKIYKTLVNGLRASYTLDLRALSLMRIGIALILFIDLIIRSLSIKAFFTDDGVLPISALDQAGWTTYSFSFHTLSGDLYWQILLFLINAICILLLLAGHRTRLLTFICWLFLTSLQNRNPFILQSGDDLLRLVLLWGIFLPWGTRYSIKKNPESNKSFFNIAPFGYLLLIASVYLFSALLKTSAEWKSEGTAIYYTLSLDQIRMPIGSFIYQFPDFMHFLTHLVYYTELIAPILILIPFVSHKVRLTGIIAIVMLHLGIFFTIYVGLFYIIGIVSLAGLIPSETMDWLEKKYRKQPNSNIEMQSNMIEKSELSFFFVLSLTLKNWFLFLVISFCLFLNLSQLTSFPFKPDEKLMNYSRILKLDQNWGMFSPYIIKDDGWYVYSGYTANKKYIDIKHNKDSLSFEKPEHIVSEFESDRWRKYSENYLYNNNNFIRPYYCKYLINKWNKEHPDKHISELIIFYMKEVSLPNYHTKPIQKLALCDCQDK